MECVEKVSNYFKTNNADELSRIYYDLKKELNFLDDSNFKVVHDKKFFFKQMNFYVFFPKLYQK